MNSPLPTSIRACLREQRWNELKAALGRLEPPEVAEMLRACSPAEQALLFRLLPTGLAADTFAFLDENAQRQLLERFNEQETRALLAELSPDDRTELFEEMPPEVVRRLLDCLSPEDRKEALMLLGYPPGSVGRLMSPHVARIEPQWTVEEALARLRESARDAETLNMVYVVDQQGRLLDELRLRTLVMADPGSRVENLMNRQFTALSALDSEDQAVSLMRKTGYFALPVIDSQGVLLGVVTADDVLDVAVEGATTDFHKGGGLTPVRIDPLTAPTRLLYARRVSWLVILVFINIFSGAGIAYFEELISSVVALVFFLPLLIDSGGNAGSQAATLVIRAMALGQVQVGHYLYALWKEVRVSVALGLTMSAAVFVVAYFRSGPQVAVVVALAMTSIVVVGSLIGMSLPFLLSKLKLDPAAASAPLVTSLADILGVLIYLGIANIMLGSMVSGE